MPPPSSRQPGRRSASERRRTHDKRLREAWAERRRNHFRTFPLPMVNMGGEVMAVAAVTTAVVSTAPAPAQAMITSHPASSTPIPLDPPQKRAKTVTEAVRASSRSAVVTKKQVIDQFDGGNTLSSSCDTSLHENIPPTTL